MNHKLPEKTQASSVEKVRFTDGMIVTAEDLHDAMNYPLDVFRTLVRAFFGCGIVCGLEVRKCTEVADKCEGQGLKGDPEHAVCITPGVAIDCHGYPIELCHAVTLEFPPDDCGNPYKACIAIRRMATEECPRPTDLCASGTQDASYECTRLREQVQVKAFIASKDELPPSLCRFAERSELKAEEDPCAEKEETVALGNKESTECTCLKACENRLCCEEAWVLLACVKVGPAGIEFMQESWRKHVKPIDCVCHDEKSLFGMPAAWRESFKGTMAAKKVGAKKRSPQQK
jgi:hypothetical protein